ncbi:spectrin alpha chain-like [Glandiceps talaboti]
MIEMITIHEILEKKAFLANEDLGDSLDSVEALIKKHEDFKKSLAAQEEEISAHVDFAVKLVESEHFAAEDVSERRDNKLVQAKLASHFL